MRNRVMELRAQGANVYQFEGGEPFRPTPDYIKDAMVAALKDNKTRYAPSSGIPELRQAITDKLRTRNNIPAKVENVLVVIGGMQGLFAAFQSVVNPGDEVLVFSPFWTPIKDLVAHCEGRIVLVPTQEARADGFATTLARYASEKTRAIYFNTPTNPSGVVFTRARSRRRSLALQSIATWSSSPTKLTKTSFTTASTSRSHRSTACLNERSRPSHCRSLTR